MKNLLKTLIVTTGLTLSINYGAELAESANPTQTTTEAVRSTDLEIWRQTALSCMISTGTITAEDIANLLAYEPKATYEQSTLLVIDLVLLMQHPYLCPRTAEELRTFKLREAIEDREDLSLDQKRILLAFLPAANTIDRMKAIYSLEKLHSNEMVIPLYRSIVETSPLERIEYLKTLLGFSEAVHLVYGVEHYNLNVLEAARYLELLIPRDEVIQMYQRLKESDDSIIQETATDRLSKLLEE
jgi:hypothetical protein